LVIKEGRLEPVSEWKTYIKPPVEISPKITELTGITNEMVATAPTFSQIAQKFVNQIRGCDLMAYNGMTLDLPMLAEECDRAGVAFLKLNEFRLIDPYQVFCIEEPRTLSGALNFYCNEVLEDAHDALNDVKAMVKVFNAQMNHYEHIPKNEAEYFNYQNQRNDKIYADYSRKLHWVGHELHYTTWGKYKDLPVMTDESYIMWICNNNFPADTKRVLMDYVEKVQEAALQPQQETVDTDEMPFSNF
jgi:DNA polymerase-3 subunit epsilon